jgi:formylglycine-generating enzyme required for sulfatase activity
MFRSSPGFIGISLLKCAILLLSLVGCDNKQLDNSFEPMVSRPSDSPTYPFEIVFVRVGPGSVVCGSPNGEPGRDSEMERQIDVVVPCFEISAYEITRKQYYSVMDPQRTLSSSEERLPISGVSFFDVERFLMRLNAFDRNSRLHRLPTEPEWEFSCRAGSGEMVSVWRGRTSLQDAIESYKRSENSDVDKLKRGLQASCNIEGGVLKSVGSYPPNGFGLYDFHGNVAEWVSSEQTFSSSRNQNFTIVRGGSAYSPEVLSCRSAYRYWHRKDKPSNSIGFRVVRVVE